MKEQICDSSAADLAKRTAKIIISSDATAKNLVSKNLTWCVNYLVWCRCLVSAIDSQLASLPCWSVTLKCAKTLKPVVVMPPLLLGFPICSL